MNGDPGTLAAVIQEVDKSLRGDLTPGRLCKQPGHKKLLKEDVLLCLWLRSSRRLPLFCLRLCQFPCPKMFILFEVNVS